MAHNWIPTAWHALLGLLALAVVARGAAAEPLEDVALENGNQGVVAIIQLSGPIHYLRHFPASHGKTLEIYYDRVQDASDTEAWLDDEVRKSPPSKDIPSFTVTTRNQETAPKLVIDFAREVDFSVAEGKDRRSLLITLHREKLAASTEPLPELPTIAPEVEHADAASAKINKDARALLKRARDALSDKNNDAAVGTLNTLLLLPPNDYTQEALEWVGVARERAGQIDKAKIEYGLYLRLYPKSDGAARVKQRLAALGKVHRPARPTLSVPIVKEHPEARMVTFGSVSSRYYYGKSRIESTSNINGVPITNSQALTDQSMIITSVDLNGRYRTENSETRLVLRDMDTRNLLANQPSQNRLYSAYAQIRGLADNYLVRAGRQSSMGAGVLGRFDGIAASYGNAQQLRMNAVAGELAEYIPGSKPRFVGASVDKGVYSLYAINQTVEGQVDRRAVGTELHYFDDKKNAYGLLDYDTYFRAVNAAEITGTARGISMMPEGNLSFMLDHRKAPSLSIRNALNGATTSSIADLLQTHTISEVRDLAMARTSISNMGQIGITHPLRGKWQLGGDFRVTNTTGLPTSGTPTPTTGPSAGVPTTEGFIPAIPSRGLEKSVTAQLIGSGLYKQGDVWSGSLTYSTSSAVRGNSFFLYTHTQASPSWLVDVTLQLSYYKDQFGGTTRQTMPLLRGTYRISERFTFDMDGGYQKIEFSGPSNATNTNRYFYSAGMRWDF